MKNKFSLFTFSYYLLSIVLTIVMFNKLPELVPSHFNQKFEVDQYGSKNGFLIFSLGLPLFMYIIKIVLKKIDPLKENYKRFEKAYSITINILILMFSSINIAITLYATKNLKSIKEIFFLIFGVAFIALGNYLPQLKRNFFIGIKTPWTLSDEDTWNRTHKVGGIVFIIFGLLFILDGFILKSFYSTYFVIVGIVFLVLYSYLIFPKDKKVVSKKDLKENEMNGK